MKKEKLFMFGTRLMLIAALLCPMMVQSQAQAKGSDGEYADRVAQGTTSLSPNAGKLLDQAGTVWNEVDDLYKRMIVNSDQKYEEAIVYVGSGTALGTLNGAGTAIATGTAAGGFGAQGAWQIADSTGSINQYRHKVRITNPLNNASGQTFYIGIATGSTQGTLTFPTTSQITAILTVGQSYDFYGSTVMHPVLITSGTVPLVGAPPQGAVVQSFR